MPPTTDHELSPDGEAIVSRLESTLGNRLDAVEEGQKRGAEQLTELSDKFLKLSGDVEADRKALEERFAGDVPNAPAFEPGMGDHFAPKGADVNPATQFSLERALFMYFKSDFSSDVGQWDIDRTPWAKDKDKHLFPEVQLIAAATEKAQSADVDTAGGFAVPPEWNAEFIPKLLARAIVPRMGATLMAGLQGSPVTWPRLDTAASSGWVGELVNSPETSVDVGQVKLEPHALCAYMEASDRLLRQTGGNFETILRRHLEEVFAKDLDRAALIGGTDAAVPTGLKNLSPSPGVVDWSTSPGTALASWNGALQVITDKIHEYPLALANADALFGSLGFIMSPSVMNRLQRFPKDADGRPILQIGNPNEAPNNQFSGYPFGLSTQLAVGADADLFFGNWSDLIIGQWGTLVISSTREGIEALKGRKTGIGAFLDADIAFWHPESFAITSGLDISSDPS